MFDNRIRRYLTWPSVLPSVGIPVTGFSALPAFASAAGVSDVYQIARQQAVEQLTRAASLDHEITDEAWR